MSFSSRPNRGNRKQGMEVKLEAFHPNREAAHEAFLALLQIFPQEERKALCQAWKEFLLVRQAKNQIEKAKCLIEKTKRKTSNNHANVSNTKPIDCDRACQVTNDACTADLKAQSFLLSLDSLSPQLKQSKLEEWKKARSTELPTQNEEQAKWRDERHKQKTKLLITEGNRIIMEERVDNNMMATHLFSGRKSLTPNSLMGKDVASNNVKTDELISNENASNPVLKKAMSSDLESNSLRENFSAESKQSNKTKSRMRKENVSYSQEQSGSDRHLQKLIHPFNEEGNEYSLDIKNKRSITREEVNVRILNSEHLTFYTCAERNEWKCDAKSCHVVNQSRMENNEFELELIQLLLQQKTSPLETMKIIRNLKQV